MQNVITVATMRDSDAHTIAEYTPSRELMHRRLWAFTGQPTGPARPWPF